MHTLHLDLFLVIHSYLDPVSQTTLAIAINNYKLPHLTSTQFVECAAYHGLINLVNWGTALGCDANPIQISFNLAKGGHIQFLSAYPINNRMYDGAIAGNHPNIIDYLNTRGLMMAPTQMTLRCIQYDNLQLFLKYYYYVDEIWVIYNYILEYDRAHFLETIYNDVRKGTIQRLAMKYGAIQSLEYLHTNNKLDVGRPMVSNIKTMMWLRQHNIPYTAYPK